MLYHLITQNKVFKDKIEIKKSSHSKSGSDLLSHAIRQSTISAIGFHVRVRNGIVCCTNAITTRLAIRASFSLSVDKVK
jgi:hypothetical protein